MKVETNDPRPAYVQVADGIRKAILSGELAAGTKLPSGRDLAEQWGVALMTLQKAVEQLRSEGLVYSQQGRGVFVAAPGNQPPADDLTALRQKLETLSSRVDAIEQQLQQASPQSRQLSENPNG